MDTSNYLLVPLNLWYGLDGNSQRMVIVSISVKIVLQNQSLIFWNFNGKQSDPRFSRFGQFRQRQGLSVFSRIVGDASPTSRPHYLYGIWLWEWARKISIHWSPYHRLVPLHKHGVAIYGWSSRSVSHGLRSGVRSTVLQCRVELEARAKQHTLPVARNTGYYSTTGSILWGCFPDNIYNGAMVHDIRASTLCSCNRVDITIHFTSPWKRQKTTHIKTLPSSAK